MVAKSLRKNIISLNTSLILGTPVSKKERKKERRKERKKDIFLSVYVQARRVSGYVYVCCEFSVSTILNWMFELL